MIDLMEDIGRELGRAHHRGAQRALWSDALANVLSTRGAIGQRRNQTGSGSHDQPNSDSGAASLTRDPSGLTANGCAAVAAVGL